VSDSRDSTPRSRGAHAQAALTLRSEGKNFTEIGRTLGISRQAAQQLCAGDGSAEVRIVLPADILAKVDAFPEDRPTAVVAILRYALFH
jgi:hypothetical protein